MALHLSPMKRFLFLLLFPSTLLQSQAQEVQWAATVIEFSSQLTPIQYSAAQALGKPNVLPAGGQNPNAWVPDKPSRNEFLKLGFSNPISIRQIAIGESYNPSALYRILLYDEAGNEHEVTTFSPRAIPLKGRMLNVFVDQTPYKVAAVRLEFDGAAVPDYYGIDAVAISDSSYPVVAFVPTPELLATDIVIEPLGSNVNSEHSELNPILSPDGKTMYFSRRNHPQNVGGVKDKEDIWYSELGEDGRWQLARNVGSPINNNYPNFINSINAITPDGTSALVLLGNQYKENGKMSAGVSVSTFADGNWSTPTPLNIANEYNMNDKANYFLSNSRKVLVMSIERRDTQGDRDLYVSFLKDADEWSEPLNLGTTINTVAEESDPFLANDETTLYFSSRGFSGYGGADIYVSRRLDDTWTKWSEPENLGPQINSTLDDLFFNIPNFSEYAYYSRGVSEDNMDIFRVKMPILRSPDVWVAIKGKLVDAATQKPVGARIVVEQLPTGTSAGTTQSHPETGDYEIRVKAGELYRIHAEAKDHVSESQNLDLRNVKSDQTIDKDFALQPIQFARISEGVTLILNSIFFDLNKADLKPESFPELNQMIAMLKERSGMIVEISGHTCSLGSAGYNMKLSVRRAEAVKNFMIENGIEASRVVTVGHGKSRPLVSNDDEEGRSLNRRVEFKIVKL
jgi:OmpA-OmpF porin, OOP family